MERLSDVVRYLRKLPSDFYGQVLIRVRQGRAVVITEERTIKLGDDEQNGTQRRLRK